MNIQKIFQALDEDTENSALGIICGELTEQGYSVVIDDTPVNSDGFYNDQYPEIERLNVFKIHLFKNGILEQKFTIEFIDYHEFIIKKAEGC